MIPNSKGFPLVEGQVSHEAINAAITAAISTKQTAIATHTVETLPAADASNAGVIVYVSNGNAGAPCLALSNGVTWAVIALGVAPAIA